MSEVVFDDLTPWYPLDEQLKYNVLVSTSVTGHEQRRLISSVGRRMFTVNFSLLSKAGMLVLWNFYVARNGEYDYFYFPNNNDRVVNENVGNKTATQTHTAAVHPIGNIYLIDDAGELALTTDYTVVKTTGVITFNRNITNCWLNYDPCVKVRFVKELTRSEVFNAHFSTQIELIEVL